MPFVNLPVATNLLYRWAAAGWMLMLYIVSAQPGLTVPGEGFGTDKLVHSAIYAGLAYLLYRALLQKAPVNAARTAAIFLLSIGFGLTDEFHQGFVPGRVSSGWDLLADGIGILTALALLAWYERQ